MSDDAPRLPLPYPDEEPKVLGFVQTHWVRRCCLKVALPFLPCWKALSTVVVLLNCWILTRYNPCMAERDFLLSRLDHVFFVFFLIEMSIFVLAHGIYGPKGHLRSNWNKLDAFIIFVELLGYCLRIFHLDLSVVLDSLRPLRLIGRIPSLRRHMQSILGTLPIYCNVVLLIAFLNLVFGIVSLQLWKGQLHNRCFLGAEAEPLLRKYNKTMPLFFDNPKKLPFLCSSNERNGQHCSEVPKSIMNLTACPTSSRRQLLAPGGSSDCVDWNGLYSVCRRGPQTPYKGAINFDDIGHAMITIFQVITLEGWSEVMYFVMDSYSFWSFLFFIFVVVIGAFIMMNVCAVAVTTQFSICMQQQKELERPEERAAYNRLLKQQIFRFLRVILTVFRHHTRIMVFDRNYWRLHRRCWHRFRVFIKSFVDSNFFDRLILFVVCISILDLALEHHNQPELLTEIHHYGNVTINIIFIMEVVLRLIAYQFNYFTNPNTLADFFIVVASTVELFLVGEGMLAVLRAFRLMRLGRLIRFLPYLRKQVWILLKTMQQATPLVFIMVLLVFVFSQLGMHLFGCKFRLLQDFGMWRKNFDSIMWSMVTVFQILTQEDWNYVLYNTMAATNSWSALYFIIVIMLGKNLFLNIIVSIVVHNFQSQDTQVPVEEQVQPYSAFYRARSKMQHGLSQHNTGENVSEQQRPWYQIRMPQWCKNREQYSLYLFAPSNRFRVICKTISKSVAFERLILLLIALSCIALALERPSLSPQSTERIFLTYCDFIFAGIFLIEMILKVIALGLIFGKGSYIRDPWNFMDGLLVILSAVDMIVTLADSEHHNAEKNMLGILKVLRLLRTLRPLRVLKHAPRLKLAINALLASVGPITNIVAISVVIMFFYGILGVQLFKGAFNNCQDDEFHDVRNISEIKNKTTCEMYNYNWERRPFNFDNIFQALMSLFVMYSKDGWMNIMYDGIDAVNEDMQPINNYHPWVALYFISFMIISFFLLDMFIGIMVDTFLEVQKKQKNERIQVLADQAHDQQGRRLQQAIDQSSALERLIPIMDIIMSVVIIVNVLIMAVEHYGQPTYVEQLIDYTFYIVTAIFICEIVFKLKVLKGRRFIKSNWNRLDLLVVVVSIVGVVLSVLHLDDKLPLNLSIIRSLRVLSLAQVLKIRKIQVLLHTIMKTLKQVGNLCLLFAFFFFIYAVLTVELFGDLECSEDYPCVGLSRYSNFQNFASALLTLFKMSTGDNWSGILVDTLRECRPGSDHCAGYLYWAAPLCFSTFVVMVQFVLVNLIVAAIMQAQEESNEEKKEEEKKEEEEEEEVRNISEHRAPGSSSLLPEPSQVRPRHKCICHGPGERHPPLPEVSV